jgi:hypothetical protein
MMISSDILNVSRRQNSYIRVVRIYEFRMLMITALISQIAT